MSNQPKHPFPGQNPAQLQHVYINNAARPVVNPQNLRDFQGQIFQDPRNLHRNVPQALHPIVFSHSVVPPGQKPGHPPANVTLPASMQYVEGHIPNMHATAQQHSSAVISPMQMQHPQPLHRQAAVGYPFQFAGQPQHHLLVGAISQFPHGAHQPQDHQRQFANPQFYNPQAPHQTIMTREGANPALNNDPKHIQPLQNVQGNQVIYKDQQFPQNPITATMYQQPLQDGMYTNFNSAAGTSTTEKKKRSKAILNIVDPSTGKNISDEIYNKDESKPVNNEKDISANKIGATFVAQVAAALNEPSTPKSVAETTSQGTTLPNPVNKETEATEVNAVSSEEKLNSNPEAVAADFKAKIQATLEETQKVDSKCQQNVENISFIDPVDVSKPSGITESSSQIAECVTESVNVDSKIQAAPELVAEKITTTEVSRDNPSVETAKDKSEVDQSNKIEPIAREEVDFVKPVDTPPTLSSTVPSIQSKPVAPVASLPQEVPTEMPERLAPATAAPTNEKSFVESVKENRDDTVSKCKVDSKKIESVQKQSESKNNSKRNRNSKNLPKNNEQNRRNPEKEESEAPSSVVQVPPPNVDKVEVKVDSSSQSNVEKDSEIPEVDSKIKHEIECEKEKLPVEKSIEQESVKKSIVEENITEIKIEENEIVIEKNKQIKEENVDEISESKIDSEIIESVESKDDEIIIDENNINSDDKSKVPSLKYVYSDDQWSPLNTAGKKVYGREFLMNLQYDPSSKVKPSNLPDLDVVLNNCSMIQNNLDNRKGASYEHGGGNHNYLLPTFAKPYPKMNPTPNKKGGHGSDKPKSSMHQKNIINYSVGGRDVKLREAQNAWKPQRVGGASGSAEETKTQNLYKKVRSVLNKLTPQKFETLVNQVRELDIDTEERLQGVIDLVFKKAVDEPNFSVAYALMCKELSNMKVANANDNSSANFRKLLINRCQTEFEKNTVDENARSTKVKEIDDCTDPEKKKELRLILEDEERRMRMRSVGNIRFIGELFKQNMLTSKIMEQCIRHLLLQNDEENLECLCKLLTTVGKVLETKGVDLTPYFQKMSALTKVKGKVSSRIRFMLLDVIDLRLNQWVPRRDDSNPKTMDQIQKEVETENINIEINNSLMNTPRKDDRSNSDKNSRNRGGRSGRPNEDSGGWSTQLVKTRQVYTVQADKLKAKPPAMDDMQLGSRSNYQWSQPKVAPPLVATANKYDYLANMNDTDKQRSVSHYSSSSRSTDSRAGPRDQQYPRDYKSSNYERNSRNSNYQSQNRSHSRPRDQAPERQEPPAAMPPKNIVQAPEPQLTDDKIEQLCKKYVEEYILEDGESQAEAIQAFRTTFPMSIHDKVTFNILYNEKLTRKPAHQIKTSEILAELLVQNCMRVESFKHGLKDIFEDYTNMILDMPKYYEYVARFLVHPVIHNTSILTDLKGMLQPRDKTHILLIVELMSEINKLKDVDFTKEVWRKSECKWNDFEDNQDTIEMNLKKHGLDFLL